MNTLLELHQQLATRLPYWLSRKASLSLDDAEECCSQAWVTAWTNQAKHDPTKSNLRSWVFRLCLLNARNLKRSLFKRSQRFGAVADLDTLGAIPPSSAPTVDPFPRLASRPDLLPLARLLSEGLTTTQAGESLGYSRATAYRLVSEIRTILQDC